MQKIEKVYYGSAIVFSLMLSGVLYRIFSILETFESIETAQFVYHESASILTYAVPACFIVLMLFSNVVFIKSGQGRYFIFSYLFFAAFTILDYVLAGETYFDFTKRTGLWSGGFSIMGLAGLFLCFVAFILTLANYLILSTLRKTKIT
ncbi:hypothetical protein JNL27_08805 [bacterium]|nr:hypothetical protein [bacterium]